MKCQLKNGGISHTNIAKPHIKFKPAIINPLACWYLEMCWQRIFLHCYLRYSWSQIGWSAYSAHWPSSLFLAWTGCAAHGYFATPSLTFWWWCSSYWSVCSDTWNHVWSSRWRSWTKWPVSVAHGCFRLRQYLWSSMVNFSSLFLDQQVSFCPWAGNPTR